MYFNYNLTKQKKNIIYLIILGIFSLSINQHYGNRGVFPIDSFLIFDAAYNITLGNHPFKDYWLITGPFVDYVQALFFLVFGVNWFSYTFHASIFNMLLCLSSFYFFSRLGLNQLNAFLYSLGVAILAYPSIGTPFIDHHSVILSLLSVYSIILGILFKNNIFWFLTSLFLVLSFFSKQIPSVYFLVLFFFTISFCFFYLKNLNKKNFIFLLSGALIPLLLIYCVFLINEIPIKSFLNQYILYPYSLGEERMDVLALDFKNLIGQFKFIYLASIPLVVSTFILILKKDKNLIQKEELVISLLFLGSIAVILYYQLLTKNQVLIFFFIPILAGLSHLYAQKYIKKKYFVHFVLIIFIVSTLKYHLRFNQNKKFMDLMSADISLAVDAGQLDSRLSGLKWITPHYLKNPQNEINFLISVKNILSETKERKMIITDYQFFSSLLKNKFASPNKWYDNRSIPDKKNKYYNMHKNFFLSKIKEKKIEYLFFIGKHKHKMSFFKEFINENECVASEQIDELLVKFDISKCKF
jgi:hypothetical protein